MVTSAAQPEIPRNTVAEGNLRNQRTITAYEGYARNYALLIGPDPSADDELSMRTFLAHIPSGGHVLEVGSGTGHSADFLEENGVRVRRTDATRAFLEIQSERGRHAELLNVLTDDVGGPYDGIIALCVLIHIDKSQLEMVLVKLRQALRPSGCFLLSMREGDGAVESGPWYTALWRDANLRKGYSNARLTVLWTHRHVDVDGDRWITHLLQRQ